MVTGRYVEVTAEEGIRVLLESRVLRALEMRHHSFMVCAIVASFVTRLVAGMMLLGSLLAPLLFWRPDLRDNRFTGGGFPVVRRAPTLGRLGPVQILDGKLVQPVLLVVVQLSALDALAAEVHAAVYAFLKTVDVALVAGIASHGPDDGKLES